MNTGLKISFLDYEQDSLVVICSECHQSSCHLSLVTKKREVKSLFLKSLPKQKNTKKQTSDVCEISFSLSLIITHLYSGAPLQYFGMPIDRCKLIQYKCIWTAHDYTLPAFLTLEQEEILGFTLSLSLFPFLFLLSHLWQICHKYWNGQKKRRKAQ